MTTVRTPLATTLGNRNASFVKDARIVNGYVEGDEQGKKFIKKRPGMADVTGVSNGTSGGGLFSFEGVLYYVKTGVLYSYSGGVETSIGAVQEGTVYWTETRTVPYLVFHVNDVCYTYDGVTLSSVSDLDFPTNQVPAFTLAAGIVYLDGFVFVATTTGRLYNSALEDPTSWNALDYISRNFEPDGCVAITKHQNYVLTFGEWSYEIFYNAGNATGSPLLRNDTSQVKIGCAAKDTVVSVTQAVLWVGQSRESGKGVYILDGFTPNKISSASIERWLNASDLLNARAYSMTTSGHTFYVLSLPDKKVDLVYDISEKVWYQWAFNGGTTDPDTQQSYEVRFKVESV